MVRSRLVGHITVRGLASGLADADSRFSRNGLSRREATTLRRVLRGDLSPAGVGIESARRELASELEKGLKELHWRDFEVLVDLLFRQSGWRRLSTVGDNMKDTDLNLLDPLTGIGTLCKSSRGPIPPS